MNRRDQRPRRALSKFELLGCLVALGGGVWVGAQYTGVNLEALAYQTLEDADLLEQIPEEWRPVDPECTEEGCSAAEAARLTESDQLRSELQQLQAEASRLTGAEPKALHPVSLSPEDQATCDRTFAYWRDLSRIVAEVTAIQQQVAALNGTEDHGHAVAVRLRALDYGEKSVNLLDYEGVDLQAVATGTRVSEWFKYGSETLTAALELRGRQPVEGRAASAAEVWSRTEGELRMRTDLVARKSRETAAYLTNRYFLEFPALAL